MAYAEIYVDGVLGDDANAGTSEGAGNALRTFQEAFSGIGGTLGPGGTIWIKNSGVYNQSVDMTTAGGGLSNRNPYSGVSFVGYDSVTGDNGQAILQYTGAGMTVSAFYGAISVAHLGFFNLVIADFPQYAFTSSGADYGAWWNCEISGNTYGGVYADGEWNFVACNVHHNGNGSRAALYGRLGNISYCKVHNNNGGGIRKQDGFSIYRRTFVHNCLLAKNTNGPQLQMTSSSGIRVFDCTIDGNGTDVGIDQSSTAIYAGAQYFNNIIYSCTTGLTTNDSTPQGDMLLGYMELNNLFYGNDVNYHNQGSDMPAADGYPWLVTGSGWPACNIYDDNPLFTDPDNMDYTLQDGSPAQNAGTDARTSEVDVKTSPQDIGAFKTLQVGYSRSVYGG